MPMTREERLAKRRKRRRERLKSDPIYREQERAKARILAIKRQGRPENKRKERERNRKRMQDPAYRAIRNAYFREYRRRPEVKARRNIQSEVRRRRIKAEQSESYKKLLAKNIRAKKRYMADPDKKRRIQEMDVKRKRKQQGQMALAHFAQLAAKLEAKR